MPAKGCSDATPSSPSSSSLGTRRALRPAAEHQRLRATTTRTRARERQVALDWYPNPDHVGIFAGIDAATSSPAACDVTPVTPSDVSDPIKLVARQAGRPRRLVRAGGVLRRPEATSRWSRWPRWYHRAQLDHRPHRPRHPHGHRPAGQDDRRGRKRVHHRLRQNDAADVRVSPIDSVHLVTVGFNLVPALLSGRVDAIAGGFQNIEGIDIRAHGGGDHRVSRRPLRRAQLRRAGDHRQSRPDAVRPKLSRGGAGIRDRLDQGHQLGSESSRRSGCDHARTELS